MQWRQHGGFGLESSRKRGGRNNATTSVLDKGVAAGRLTGRAGNSNFNPSWWKGNMIPQPSGILFA
eukprot:1157779-Pelagomonas_calceolata.AAC.19